MKIDVTLITRPDFSQDGQGGEPKSEDDATVPISTEGLGIKVQAIPPYVREQLDLKADAPGVLIVSVDPESDAADEGLAPRQIITSIDDIPVHSVADWNRIVKGLRPGESVKVDVDLGNQNQIVFLTVPQPKSK